jgi:hypothetical protein
MPHVDDEIGSCVGFIGFPSEQGFIADGTCFFVMVQEETEVFYYLVTARHLVRPLRLGGAEREPLDSKVAIRFSRLMRPPLVLETIRREWTCPTDRHVDLAIRPFDYRAAAPDGDLAFLPLLINGENPIVLSDERWEQEGGRIRTGDEIFIPSLFPGHVGERRNIPVIRFGHIAAPALEPVRVGSPTVPAFLIETRSLGGISGAPVFLHLRPLTIRNLPRAPLDASGRRTVPYALIGMVLGAHGGRYASDFVTVDPEEDITTRDAEFNAGISVVLPIQHALALIESDPLKQSRLATLDAIKRQSGFRPTDA